MQILSTASFPPSWMNCLSSKPTILLAAPTWLLPHHSADNSHRPCLDGCKSSPALAAIACLSLVLFGMHIEAHQRPFTIITVILEVIDSRPFWNQSSWNKLDSPIAWQRLYCIWKRNTDWFNTLDGGGTSNRDFVQQQPRHPLLHWWRLLPPRLFQVTMIIQ